MKISAWPWDAVLMASIVLIPGLCAQSQQVAQAEDGNSPSGKIVRISPAPEGGEPIPLALETENLGEELEGDGEPTYWIGITGRPVESAVLRTQLQLAEDMGIAVERVVPDSPADKAGLRRHDIILRANGAGVHGMKVLQEQVRRHQGKPLELKLIRLGKEETLIVVPEERPADLQVPLAEPGQGRGNGFGGRADLFAKLMEQLQGGKGLPGDMRRIGPGVFLPGMEAAGSELPQGVSVSIEREDGGPTKITVKRGDKTWHIVGDDRASLEQLPADLRPYVERLLRDNGEVQGQPGFDWEAELEHILPDGMGRMQRRLGRRPAPVATPQEQELSQRMERLEEELQALKKRLAEE